MPSTGRPARFAFSLVPFSAINVVGKVTLGSALLERQFQSTSDPLSPGHVFTIITNDGIDSVVGTFLGLPQGALVNTSLGATGIRTFELSYVGGTGNDVTLTLLRESASWTTTTVTSAHPLFAGQTSTFAAAVTSATGTPAGTLSFYDGNILLGSSTLDESGRAKFATRLAPGFHIITAAYEGSPTFATSRGNVSQTVPPATVPTLGSWMLILLAISLGVAATISLTR